MTNADLTKIAARVRLAHEQKRAFRIPAMTVRDLGRLSQMLAQPEALAA